jgi:hypothetical protein
LQKNLLGRISIDYGLNGILIRIPSKKDWQMLFIAAWLAFWVIAPSSMMLKAIRGMGHPNSADWFSLLWGIGWIFGIWFGASTLVWSIGGVDLMRLTPSEVNATKTVFGITVRRRSSSTTEVRNLRYMPANSGGSRRYRRGRICYEDDRGTVTVTSGLDDAEALAVIDQMLLVHPFSRKDKAFEYLDLSG